MPLATFRKPRPTVQDAFEYLRQGYFSIDCHEYVSWDDREKALNALERDIRILNRKHLSRTKNLVLAILAGHIIVEFVLNKFIEYVAINQVDVSRERFTFSQKIALFHMFTFPAAPRLIPTLDLLNTLRNQVAHSLDLDRAQLDRLIHINNDLPGGAPKLDDRARLKAIKRIVNSVCSEMVGTIGGINMLDSAASRGMNCIKS